MESLVIEGKNYISSKRAAEVMGYTQDYIGQLARGGKISAERVGGVWYVSEEEFSGLSKDRATKGIDSIKDLSSMKVDGITNKTNTQNNSNELLNTSNNKNKITLNGVNYISSKRAAKIMGYTQDYIGQLCRGGKIEARQVGRGWYIPESVVLKNIKTESVEKQNLMDSEEIETQKKAFKDTVVFKKNVDEIPIQLKELQRVKQKVKENKTSADVRISPNEEFKTFNNRSYKEGTEKNEYYYPSFLSAVYSFDDTPLVPIPKRSRESVLHQIVAEETKNAPDRRVVTQQRQKIKEHIESKRATSDILKPKKLDEYSLTLKSPLSLIKMASLGVVMLLLASIVTFVPSTSVFSSNTGIVEAVYSLKIPHRGILKAEVITLTSETTLLETIIRTFNSFFEDTIEYKAD
ncbi:hypothetical protein HQ403_01305 [Candidatus Kaiserbacteria bacterium]|nr:hypothetical protein [Candidatus Kaiserbacteria bacterium]